MSFYSVAPLITSLLILLLGFFVFFNDKSRTLNKIFFFICLSGFVWLFSYSIGYIREDEKTAFLWLKIGYTGVIFIPLTTYHYTIEFLKIKKLKPIVLLNYLIGVIYVTLIWRSLSLIDGVSQFFWGYYPHAGSIHPLFLVHFIGLVGFSFSLWLYFFFFKKEIFTCVEIIQIKYIFLAFIVYNFASIDFLPNYGIAIYPFGFIPSFIFSILVGYSIVRYRLMGIYLVIKRTAAYSLSAGLITAFFAILIVTITNLLSSYVYLSSLKISIFAVLIIALLFNPLRNKIQTLIDKLFYKKTYEYYSTLQKVSHDLATMLDFKKIYSFLGDIIFSTLGLKKIYLLSDVSGRGFEVVYYRLYKEVTSDDRRQTSARAETEEKMLKIDNNSAIAKLLKTSDDMIILHELPASAATIGQDTIDKITSTLIPFDGEAVFPVFVDDKLELLFMLGEKLSGDIFTDEDVKLLQTISDQTSISIKIAKLYSDKLRSERFASIGMMSATFAHEIRNPLTSIKTFAQLFPEKFADAEFRNTFSKIVIDDIGRIDGLIKDLLSFSSKESVSGINALNVTELVDGVLEHQKGKFEFEKNNIALRKKYKNERIDIVGNPQKLERTLINIISNGCQAMGENGVLTVDIIPNSKEVDIKISDTGGGMSSQDMAKIFDPFYTTKTMGIGLGLAISKKIIEDHGGRIAVESKLSQGTTFTISLPVEKKSDN